MVIMIIMIKCLQVVQKALAQRSTITEPLVKFGPWKCFIWPMRSYPIISYTSLMQGFFRENAGLRGPKNAGESVEISHLFSYFTSYICGNGNLMQPYICKNCSFSVKNADEQKTSSKQVLVPVYLCLYLRKISKSAICMMKIVKNADKIAAYICRNRNAKNKDNAVHSKNLLNMKLHTRLHNCIKPAWLYNLFTSDFHKVQSEAARVPSSKSWH